MDFILNLVQTGIVKTLGSLLHNWPFLLASIMIGALLSVFVDTAKISAFLGRHRGSGVLLATAAAVGTPLCSCGTTAVVLGMMTSTMPWAPIVAFMVASPLSSPEGVVYSAGLFGWPFAVAYFVASILIGLAGGGIVAALEKRGFLRGQSRFAGPKKSATASCGCGALPVPAAAHVSAASVAAVSACGCGAPPAPAAAAGTGSRGFLPLLSRLPAEMLKITTRLLPMFLGFAFVGYMLNGLIPQGWVSALFGSGRIYGVPLAATLGLPLYINSEASLPLALGLLESGMSRGAVMAFLIAGSGTSLGAMAGALTIARWRIVALVIGILWIGAIIAGFAFDLVARFFL